MNNQTPSFDWFYDCFPEKPKQRTIKYLDKTDHEEFYNAVYFFKKYLSLKFKYIAQNKDGQWIGFENKPKLENSKWNNVTGHCEILSKNLTPFFIRNWENSLIEL